MSSSNCCFLTCIQVSQETGQLVWYSHLFHIHMSLPLGPSSSHPSRWSQSTKLSFPGFRAASHSLAVLYMVAYVCPAAVFHCCGALRLLVFHSIRACSGHHKWACPLTFCRCVCTAWPDGVQRQTQASVLCSVCCRDGYCTWIGNVCSRCCRSSGQKSRCDVYWWGGGGAAAGRGEVAGLW